MRVFKIAETKLDFGLTSKIIQSGLDVNCSKVLDKSNLQPNSPAAFFKILKTVSQSDFSVEHCYVSFLIVCDFNELEDLQTKTGTAMFSTEAKNSVIVILTKSVLQWKYFIETCNKIQSLKKLSNEIQTILERDMFHDLFNDSRKKHNTDGTFDLVRI